jgi:hypothetical protein
MIRLQDTKIIHAELAEKVPCKRSRARPGVAPVADEFEHRLHPPGAALVAAALGYSTRTVNASI